MECRENYESDNQKPPCDTENRCAITLQEPLDFSYAEQKLLDEVFDFIATGQIMSRDFDHRHMIIGLAGYYYGLKKREKSDG